MRRRDTLQALAEWLGQGIPAHIGEIEILQETAGGFVLYHKVDRERLESLESFDKPEDARRLALNDDCGEFRPLKTAPNLRCGWRLMLHDLESLRRALDAFYPAMLGVWQDFQSGALPPVPLRETLGRQTGMYAVTKKISDDQAQELIAGFCQSESGCLKRILWPLAPGLPLTPSPTLPREKFDPGLGSGNELPMLCHEACNLLVAKAREVVKKAAAGK